MPCILANCSVKIAAYLPVQFGFSNQAEEDKEDVNCFVSGTASAKMRSNSGKTRLPLPSSICACVTPQIPAVLEAVQKSGCKGGGIKSLYSAVGS